MNGNCHLAPDQKCWRIIMSMLVTITFYQNLDSSGGEAEQVRVYLDARMTAVSKKSNSFSGLSV